MMSWWRGCFNTAEWVTVEVKGRIPGLCTKAVYPKGPKTQIIGLRSPNSRISMVFGPKSLLFGSLDTEDRDECSSTSAHRTLGL